MSRVRRNFNRISGLRNPDLIVIACEGENREVRYFEGVRAQCALLGSQLKVLPLPKREGHLSAPDDVLYQLSAYKHQFGLKSHDELCLVIDRDVQSWSEAHIAYVARECSTRGFLLALSNPCFELWLVLHFEDANLLAEDDKQAWFESGCRFLKQKFAALTHGQLPSLLESDDFLALTRTAIENAKCLDDEPQSRWPNTLGTRVYLILEKVLKAIEC